MKPWRKSKKIECPVTLRRAKPFGNDNNNNNNNNNNNDNDDKRVP